ncbi:hypothetical protein CTheo_984 [Ceratobasidium theobromae]|uniref:MARVEL domain-containing protein n=1 Tax=Ceratobasidium theobromae TaxID=1582974 RepID=A0A5N5QVF3_9AGAM|nr:hypothetical protein CTheo_984 [Ceratobasidium theobromae]
MALFHTLRLAAFGTVLAFALIVLGISAYWVSMLQGYATMLSTSSSFGLAVGLMTFIFLLPILIVGMTRKGSFLSWVSVELGVMGLMWVLWLASASYTTSMTAGYTLNCDLALDTTAEGVCRQFQAIQAFSWLNWLIIFAYIVLLVVFIVKASNEGRSVWTADVADLGTSTAGDNATTFAPSMTSANMPKGPMTPAPMTPQAYQPSLGYNQTPQPQYAQPQPQQQHYQQGVAHV